MPKPALRDSLLVSFYISEGRYTANMYYYSSNLFLLITFIPISVITAYAMENLVDIQIYSIYNQKTNKCYRLIYNKQLLRLNGRCMNRAPVT